MRAGSFIIQTLTFSSPCYLRIGDLYLVPMQRGDVPDCLQVAIQQAGTAHHVVPKDLCHLPFGEPVPHLQQRAEELRCS